MKFILVRPDLSHDIDATLHAGQHRGVSILDHTKNSKEQPLSVHQERGCFFVGKTGYILRFT